MQRRLCRIENPPWTNCVIVHPDVKDIIAHVAIDRVSNLAELWALHAPGRPVVIGLAERRFVAEVVNCICHWMWVARLL